MKALLLSAGLGTRLMPITKKIPKCLVPIAGIPLIEYWLIQLIEFGIEEIIINIHYLADIVIQYLDNSKWKKYITLVHEDFLLGTAGTIKKNSNLLEEEAFLVAHADNLVTIDLKSFIECHKQRKIHTEITMMTFITNTPDTCGIVIVDKNNIVQDFHEKTKKNFGNLANGAVYIFEPSVVQKINNSTLPIVDISNDLIPLYLGKIQTWHNESYLLDIGNLSSLQKANKDVMKISNLIHLRDKLINTNEQIKQYDL